MRGEMLPIWGETWAHVWLPLLRPAATPEDLLLELYREFARVPAPPDEPQPPPPEAFDAEGKLVDPNLLLAREAYEGRRRVYERLMAQYEEALAGRGTLAALRQLLKTLPTTESEAVVVLRRGHDVLESFGDETLRNRFFLLTAAFFERFSLRYDLRRPFAIQPTLTGIFSGLIRELKAVASSDGHLSTLLFDFEDSVRDLNGSLTDNRIKTCIQKQMNLLEAMGRLRPAVTAATLGQICDQLGPLGIWPHDKVRDSMKNLYQFASDYPGIRHGGTPANAHRDIEMKDLVAISVLLAGFVPYLSHQFDPDLAYGS